MRRALTRAAVAALLVFSVAAPRMALGADSRPVVRIVRGFAGEPPPWFDGFVKHLQSELALRGIDVAVTRSGSTALADAELIVESPIAFRPVLRFSVASRDEGAKAPAESATRFREVNLAGVPSDGRGLALAVAADELMRSNWPRAVPGVPASGPDSDGERQEQGGATGSSDGKAAPAGDAPSNAAGRIEAVVPVVLPETSPAASADVRQAPIGRERGHTFNIAAAVASEVFAGGQKQVGPDVRIAIEILPRLEVEARGGWRRIGRETTTNGAVEGSAMVLGGALRLRVLGTDRSSLSVVGRADVFRVAYAGEARDATVHGTSGTALGFVTAAGPCGRIALTRSLRLEGELLAGASPIAATATDAWNAVTSTKGAAFLGSLGLSFGL
jgi:hypothetical protein